MLNIWFYVALALLIGGACGAVWLIGQMRQREELLRKALSERDRLWAGVQAREENVRSLVRDLPLGMTIHGRGTEIVECNHLAARLLGRPRTELLGMTCYAPEWGFLKENGAPLTGQEHPVTRAIATHQPVREVVVGLRKPGAWEPTWLLVSVEPQLIEKGRVDHVIATLVDITSQKKPGPMAEAKNLHDAVTGCFSLDFLPEFERMAVGDQLRWGCLVIDIDDLAPIVDEHGQQTADRKLRLMARFLMMQLRAGEAVVRLGAGRFLALLTAIDESTIEIVIDRIRREAHAEAPMAFRLGKSVRDGDEPLQKAIDRANEEKEEIKVLREFPGGRKRRF